MSLYNQSVIACHECDALLHNVPVANRQSLLCPRCGCVLFRHRADAVTRGLAISLTGLILAIPANFLPIMTFSMLGVESADTLFKGAMHLFHSGDWWMGVLVLFCSIVAPITELILVAAICLLVIGQRYDGLLVPLLKFQSHIRRWAMLEVYMLSILVAYVKMLEDGDINFGSGMVFFTALLMAVTLNVLLFDTHEIWERVGQHRERLYEDSQ